MSSKMINYRELMRRITGDGGWRMIGDDDSEHHEREDRGRHETTQVCVVERG